LNHLKVNKFQIWNYVTYTQFKFQNNNYKQIQICIIYKRKQLFNKFKFELIINLKVSIATVEGKNNTRNLVPEKITP